MKRKDLIFLVILFGLLSCNPGDFNLDDDSNLIEHIDSNSIFSYTETNFYDDYFGDTNLNIFINNQTIKINSSNKFSQFQILESEIYYKNESEILKYNPNTNQTTFFVQLPNNQINNFHISPNQKYLAYSDNKDIILMDLENETTENITFELEGDFDIPKWSPDGNSILIRNQVLKIKNGENAPTVTGNYKIYSAIEQDFQDVEMFDEFAFPGQAEWSPNNEMLVYNQYGSIFIYYINSQSLNKITSNKIVASEPQFSKNGKMISYFSSDQSDNGNNWQNFLTIYNIENQTNKVVNSNYSYDASWKSDSTLILYCTKSGIFLYELETEINENLIKTDESKLLQSTQFVE